MQNAPTAKKRGCLFYGCITIVVLTLVLSVGGYFAIRYVINKAKSFTDTQQATLEVVDVPEPERAAIQLRFDEFKDGIENGKNVPPLELSEQELNALISGDPNWRGRLHLDLEGDEMKAKVAMPLDFLKVPPLRGRFLNGEATLKVSVENGTLVIRTTRISAKGKALPDAMLRDVKNKNWAEGSFKDEILQRIENAEIKNEKLIITPRTVKE